MNAKKLAIIDLGTNTFHLLIASIDEKEDFSVEEKFKEPVKLGEGGITKGYISPAAFQRGIKALKKFRKLIDSKRADEVRALATSAIRSASNREDFVKAAKEEAGIDIKVINGNEEAALIFEGVRNGILLPPGEATLVIDIGGGSVEFIVCREGKAQLLRSLPIGAARMLEAIRPEDPLTLAGLERTKTFLKDQVNGLLDELREFDIRFMVGSSGSFETLGSMIAMSKNDNLSAGHLNSYRFSDKDFRKVNKQIVRSNRSQRLKLPGMDPMRVDMIGMASLLIELLLDELKVTKMMVSSYALKEGILFNFIQEEKEKVNKFLGNASRNVRAKSIKNLCEKYRYEPKHALKVSELALSIHQQLSHLPPVAISSEELLRYGALCHDIGYFINRSGHHKHGQYIIMHSNLSGFSHDELVVLGNVVRYHRKNLPTRDHFHYKVLDQPQRLAVRTLAGIVRIADNLDRGGRGFVQAIKVIGSEKSVEMQITASQPVDIEIQAATEQLELLEQVLDKKITIYQV